MSIDIAAVRTTLAGRLSPILTTYPTVPAKPEVPCAYIGPTVSDAHATLSGAATVEATVQLLVQLADWDSAQKALDAYLPAGAGSVITALEDTAGGTVVKQVGPYGHVTIGEVTYATLTLTVEVFA